MFLFVTSIEIFSLSRLNIVKKKRAGDKNSNNKGFQFWQQHNHPIELNTNEVIQQRLDYIHNNPVEAGFVDNPSAWLFRSAKGYEGVKGEVDMYYLG